MSSHPLNKVADELIDRRPSRHMAGHELSVFDTIHTECFVPGENSCRELLVTCNLAWHAILLVAKHIERERIRDYPASPRTLEPRHYTPGDCRRALPGGDRIDDLSLRRGEMAPKGHLRALRSPSACRRKGS